MTYEKQQLIDLYRDLEERLGRQPKRQEWIDDSVTPTQDPITRVFGMWSKFVLECGGKPRRILPPRAYKVVYKKVGPENTPAD